MSDYTPTTDFSAKDALTTGDPNKLIKGVDFDTEFDAINVAIATKYDSADLASQAEAEAESSTTKLLSPGRLANWADYNAGMIGDIHALADPNADVLLGWDDTAGAAIGFTLHSSILHTGTELSVNHDAATNFVADEHVAHSSISIIAGAALGGGGTIDGNVTLNVSIAGTTAFSPDSVDLDVDTVLVDDGGGGVLRKATTSTLVTPEVPSVVSGTADTLAETDFGKVIRYSSTSTVTITLPDGLKVGFWALLEKTGATGTINLSATTTLNTPDGFNSITKQYGKVLVIHEGSNVWSATGELV